MRVIFLFLLSAATQFCQWVKTEDSDPNSIEYFTDHASPLPAEDDFNDIITSQSYLQKHYRISPSPCHQSSCYPATGDLLIGRKSQFHASSTCGLEQPQRYCVISHLDEEEKCFTCNSQNPFGAESHVLSNVIGSYPKGKGSRGTWWQAENGKEDVSIQLDLEAEFHFTHFIMTFKTFRPAGMIVERSADHGRSWKIYRYFAYDCETTFPGIPHAPQTDITDVVCEGRYSEVAPSTKGEVIFRVLSPNLEIDNPYTNEVQDLLKMTNLRINFTNLHNLGDNLLDPSRGIQEKYYYAIYNMVVRGSCSCYGHASRCIPLDDQQVHRRDMVYGKCECQHNTKGLNCEQCEDFYNDLPWMPAIGSMTNACKRCQCHDHADRCHFDPFKYLASGNRTGGVCDDCQHFTMGANCEECRPGYFQDPARDLSDPKICKACDCSPVGSENNGECQSRTDEKYDMIAGRCICKKNIEGEKCDKCKPGFWNLDPANPNGCEPCQCNTLGTVGNMGCDQHTGICICKKNVFGRKCNQCYPGFFGLSEHEEGCQPCDCNPGSSYDNNCNTADGQCRCKLNMNGRQCEKPKTGYYCTMMDHYLYEAENSMGTPKIIRRPLGLNESQTWTGDLVEVQEGENLTFSISNIVKTMNYQLVIRYDSTQLSELDNVTLTLNRPYPVNPNGKCRDTNQSNDQKHIKLSSKDNYIVIESPFCLERGAKYHITLEFKRAKGTRTNSPGSLLIDSIMLVPTVDSVEIFKGSESAEHMKNEYIRYKCREAIYNVSKGDIPEQCQKYVCSVGAVITEILPCSCDLTGSVSTICSGYGGKCSCKSNVIGRRCDRCAPGFYGFGPKGCQPCNCDQLGSVSNLCDERTGQCPCIANVFGGKCDKCQPGYFGFPNCKPCQCNGHAEICDDKSGACINCQDNTTGPNCEKCEKDFSGDPKLGSSFQCRPCQCPGGAGTTQYFATECSLSLSNSVHTEFEVSCKCKTGYDGLHCQKCSKNYFGNPLAPGGSCEKCMCNKNIDPNEPNSCDSDTGECLKCLHNTKGFYCEHCTDGYYGNATKKDCKECLCDMLGTVSSELRNCDKMNGQCKCLPNVIGRQCDQCSINHWRIASGKGCDACGCSRIGSVEERCNEFTGQCKCKATFGGRTCSECKDNHWGDPSNNTCKPCNCDRNGSMEPQCERKTGKCHCKTGISGFKCSKCDRGTTGALPNCKPCGACFNDWDRDIKELLRQTNTLISKAKKTRETAVNDAYSDNLMSLSNKMHQISKLASKSYKIEDDTLRLQQNVLDMAKSLRNLNDVINKTEENNITIFDETHTMSNHIYTVGNKLNETVTNFLSKTTKLQKKDMPFIVEELQELKKDSDIAALQVKQYTEMLKKFVKDQNETNNLTYFDEINQELHNNTVNLLHGEDVVDKLELLLNQYKTTLCGEETGCSHCKISCQNGSCEMSKNCSGLMNEALETQNLATSISLISEKMEKEAQENLNKSANLLERVNQSHMEADTVNTFTNLVKSEIQMKYEKINELMLNINELFYINGTTPKIVQKIHESILNISVENVNITELSSEITEILKTTKNVDAILTQTKSNLTQAKILQEHAREIENQVIATESTIGHISNQSIGVSHLQEIAVTALNRTDIYSNVLERKIEQAKIMVDEANVTMDVSRERLERLEIRKDEFKLKINQSQGILPTLEIITSTTAKKSVNILADAKEQKRRLEKVQNYLTQNTSQLNITEIKMRAVNMYNRLTDNDEKLKRFDDKMSEYDTLLLSLVDKIEKMGKKLNTLMNEEGGIMKREAYHRTCPPE